MIVAAKLDSHLDLLFELFVTHVADSSGVLTIHTNLIWNDFSSLDHTYMMKYVTMTDASKSYAAKFCEKLHIENVMKKKVETFLMSLINIYT